MMEKIKAGEITGQTGDYMLRATAANGQIRAVAATSRDLVEKARQAHNTSPVATAALGRLMTAGVMMGSMMKADSDLLTIRVEGDGPIGGLTVTADKNGNVKGYAFHPEVMLPPNAKGKLDVGGALGVGVLSVIQDIGLKEPYVGQTILVTGATRSAAWRITTRCTAPSRSSSANTAVSTGWVTKPLTKAFTSPPSSSNQKQSG